MKLTPHLLAVGIVVGCAQPASAAVVDLKANEPAAANPAPISPEGTQPLNGSLLAADRASNEAALRKKIADSMVAAKQFQHAGAPAEALRELLWCYDVGMPQVPAYAGAPRRNLIFAIGDLAAKNPSAWPAFLERFAAHVRKMRLGEVTADSVAEFAAFESVLDVKRQGIGRLEANWQRGELIYSEKGIHAYREAGRYFYFKDDVLAKIDGKKLSARVIARIDVEKLLRESPRPANELAVVRERSANTGQEVPQILADHFAQSPLGMPRREWLRPLIHRDELISVYRGEGVFYYFKSGLLVKTDPTLVPLQQISALNEAEIFAANFRPPGDIRKVAKPKPQYTRPFVTDMSTYDQRQQHEDNVSWKLDRGRLTADPQ